ncbi:3-oxoacyl-ACP reductase FabG [Fictibacillus enclensis]|uniref:3-oxoacyl-ACP reductase FabG n=1 Tax=Fictibacillus enclensis TaxID=1017270 RepID=UPI00259FF764|nr:3-oxoacyl-ACP reductase FabG [Fictibacillus enclensis]MDM5335832.1 3-oxoacyl-ACP reductase FabG [Fictibacillus enclensis]
MSSIWHFQNKTALVTGGSNGIGRETVKSIAEAGGKVIFTYNKDSTAAKSLEAECEKYTGSATGYQVDFLSSEELQHFLDSIIKHQEVDYLINNAGIIADSPLYFMKDEDWSNVMQINLTSLFIITKNVLPSIVRQQGAIVNISSISGLTGTRGQSNYAATKAGIIGFTKSIAREAGPLGVRVNALAPGYVETDMIKQVNPKEIKKSVALRRMANATELAQCILFLLSDASSYVTGSVLVADGGII